MKKQQSRKNKGQSLIETMCGFFVIIPLGLVSVDIVALVQSTQQNEQLAEMGARAAATQYDMPSARKAVEDVLQHFQPTSVMSAVTLDDVKFDNALGTCTVGTIMEVHLPVPFPYFNNVTCKASSLQPIVSTPAPG